MTRHVQLNLAHASMQFGDTTKEKEHDARKIFARAIRRGYSWITGTEAGPGAGELRSILDETADAHGYRFWMPPKAGQDSWIAVRRTLIAGDFEGHWQPVIPGKAKQYAGRGVAAVGFDTDLIGRVNVIACHLLTRGRPNAQDPAYRVRLGENRRLTRAIGAYAREAGRGTDLVFYGGDQNIVDRTDDTFLGQPLTSAWDELKRYENTGHGNIDVIASYDRDARVRALRIDALNDREFRLNTDHYLVEARYAVRTLVER
jgi:hypothetical protein